MEKPVLCFVLEQCCFVTLIQLLPVLFVVVVVVVTAVVVVVMGVAVLVAIQTK